MTRCRNCAFSWEDRRETVYRREDCWFCRKKGPFFSRSYRIGEKTRVDPDAPACPEFQSKNENNREL